MNKRQVCETCGHPVVGAEVETVLMGKQLRLFQIIDRAGAAGISSLNVMGVLYADEPDGGPLDTNIISAHAHAANKKLAPLGLRLSSRRGPWSLWRVMAIPEAAERR